MKTFKILLALAEEDPGSLTVIQSTLEHERYQVTVEATGALETGRIPVDNFDLAITDLSAFLEKAKELNPEIMAILVLGKWQQWNDRDPIWIP